MDYRQEAINLVQNLNQRLDPSPYDTAWLARLNLPSGEARWPDLITWLLDHQYADGHWGNTVTYYHHQILCTLSALIALRENGHCREAQDAIRRAELYLWRNIHLLRRDVFESAGFELLYPSLLRDAQTLGLDVPQHTHGYDQIQTEKLRLIPADKLYSPRIATIHSIEFLGQAGDPDRLRAAVDHGGSLGNSPAATAYYLLAVPDDARAVAYLTTVKQRYSSIVNFYPFRVFELTWVLYHLAASGLPVTDFAQPDVWQELQASVTPTGLGLDLNFLATDGDSTSVGARLLLEAGYGFEPSILARFQDRKSSIFRTYDFERNVSIGTNVHALEALRFMPDYPNSDTVRDAIIVSLLDNRIDGVYWTDKWHASPYYATAHALIALLHEGSCLSQAYSYTASWLLHMQRGDGSWGFYNEGTAEETALAMLALLHYHQRYKLANVDGLHRAAAYLAQAYAEHDTYPGLYIGKILFAPYDIVRATLLAALILYQEMLGGK